MKYSVRVSVLDQAGRMNDWRTTVDTAIANYAAAQGILRTLVTEYLSQPEIKAVRYTLTITN